MALGFVFSSKLGAGRFAEEGARQEACRVLCAALLRKGGKRIEGQVNVYHETAPDGPTVFIHCNFTDVEPEFLHDMNAHLRKVVRVIDDAYSDTVDSN